MARARPDVRAFFRRYERAAQHLDTEALTSSFSDVFMSLDGSSTTALSPQALLAALPRRKQLFEAIGSDGLELADISEMPLDDLHTGAHVMASRMHNQAPRDPSPCIRPSSWARTAERGAWCSTSTTRTCTRFSTSSLPPKRDHAPAEDQLATISEPSRAV